MDRGLDFKLTSTAQNDGPEYLPNHPTASSRNWFRWVVAGLALSNFLAGIFLEAENPFPPRFPFFAAVAIGLFPAQAGLLTLWLVWGPGRFGWRLLVHWLLILGFSLAFLAGYAVMLRGKVSALEILKNYGIGLSIFPPLSLGLQLSLWPFRVYGGWRVVRVAAPEPSTISNTAREPLTIRDLLLGTLVVALALGGIRAAVAGVDVHRTTSESELLVGCFIGLLWLTLVALLGYLAALFLLLELKNSSEAEAVSLWLGYVGALLIGYLAVQSPRPGIWYSLSSTIVSFGSFAVGLGLPLLVARRDGWRLRLPRDKPDAAS
jgi:hypothetical protein